jgi:uncharacterized SAM-binding protein YcdF (DUF218 family)
MTIMTRQQFIAVLIGLLFCCCLLAKQTVQSYDNLIDQPAAQAVVVESLDSDDLVDAADDFLVIPFLFVVTCLFFVAPILPLLRYSQPIIRSPQRPPSI